MGDGGDGSRDDTWCSGGGGVGVGDGDDDDDDRPALLVSALVGDGLLDRRPVLVVDGMAVSGLVADEQGSFAEDDGFVFPLGTGGFLAAG